MRKAPDNLHSRIPLLEHAHLVRHRRRAQLVDAEAELQYIGEGHRREVVAVGVDHDCYLGEGITRGRRGRARNHAAVGDEVGVDYGVEELGVDGVVEVGVHVVVEPVFCFSFF